MSILVIGEKPSVSRELAKVLGANLVRNGDIIVFTGGSDVGQSGTSDMLRVWKVNI